MYILVIIFLHIGPLVPIFQSFGIDSRLVLFFCHLVQSRTLELLVHIFLFKEFISRSFKGSHLCSRHVSLGIRLWFPGPSEAIS